MSHHEPDPWLPFAAPVLAVTRHTENERTFRVAVTAPVQPGQFFEVSLPRHGEAPISVSGYGDGWVELTIRKVGRVTAEIFKVQAGQPIFLRGPYGQGFDPADFQGGELAVIAGGTGMASVRALVDHFVQHPGELANGALLCGFKTPGDLLFAEDFGRWAKAWRVLLTVDRSEPGWVGLTGLVTAHLDSLGLASWPTARFAVVGPPPMMNAVLPCLLGRGASPANIWISHERRMCCGIGKCGHCKMDDTYVCLDGPVFNYAQVQNLRD
jgi:anaerobic sulfite reductase subunit B